METKKLFLAFIGTTLLLGPQLARAQNDEENYDNMQGGETGYLNQQNNTSGVDKNLPADKTDQTADDEETKKVKEQEKAQAEYAAKYEARYANEIYV